MKNELIDETLRRLALAAAEKDSSRALAEKAGIPPTVLQRFVTGKRGMSLRSAAKLCEALKLRLSKR